MGCSSGVQKSSSATKNIASMTKDAATVISTMIASIIRPRRLIDVERNVRDCG
jgi:hypothetical protein